VGFWVVGTIATLLAIAVVVLVVRARRRRGAGNLAPDGPDS
jgi:hypothetical protein